MSATYPTLFSPLRVGAFELRNRVAQAALSSTWGSGGGATERQIAMYAARARAGVAMIVTESLNAHTQQHPGTRVQAVQEKNFESLCRWAEAVEGAGCRLLGQFVDPGRGRHHPGRNTAAIGASALPDDLSWTVPRVLEAHEIRRMVEDFAGTAARLKRAGFSGVELSCGHGHLFHQFLSPLANAREDEYGGDETGRTRLVREIAAAIRARCGSAFILGLKFPGEDGVPGGIDLAESARLLKRVLADGGIDYVAVAQGAHHRTLEMHIPDRSYGPLPYREHARALREAAGGVPVFGLGRITTPEEAEAMLTTGDCDGVMMGRAMIADGAWVAKAQAGRADEIETCIGCNTCWEQIIEGKGLACVVNPRLGERDETAPLPRAATAPRRVVVVGAGVAGLAAAATAAERGHAVTLLGHSAGGGFALQAALPGGAPLATLPRRLQARATKAGVETRLGAPATADAVLALGPDAVVLATGSAPRPADVRGMEPLEDTVRRLLAMPAQRDPGIAVLYDCDHTIGTYDAAELLAERFAQVVLLTPRDGFARDVALVVRQRALRRLSQRRVRLVPLVEVARFAEGVVTWRNVYNGEEESLPGVRLLAMAGPRAPRQELRAPLRAAGIEPVLVGDAKAPRDLLTAMREAHAAALAI